MYNRPTRFFLGKWSHQMLGCRLTSVKILFTPVSRAAVINLYLYMRFVPSINRTFYRFGVYPIGRFINNRLFR